MIDTHCHLYDDVFVPDLSDVFSRAVQAGISQILLPNIDLASWGPLTELVETSPIPLFPMLGLHPCSVKEDFQNQLNELNGLLKTHHSSIVGIGEIGMDLYWDKAFIVQQKQALRTQIEWALTYKLPIALHVREAFEPLFQVLSEYIDGPLSGVFHCFTGNEMEAEFILENHPNFYFGVGGVLTYKNSGLDKVIKKIPLNRILLETDAPYLPPVPHRGKRNEPAFLVHVSALLAQLFGLTTQELCAITTENAKRLFSLKQHTHEA